MWIHALTTIAAFGGIGAAIDFGLGRAGQARVRDALETYWLKFSYLGWNDFGQKEADFAIGVIDRLFGRWFFGVRRLIVCAVGALLIETYDFVRVYLLLRDIKPQGQPTIRVPDLNHLEALLEYVGFVRLGPFYLLIWFAVFSVSLSLALSITRSLSAITRRFKRIANALFALLVLVGQYAVFAALRPIVESFRDEVVIMLAMDPTTFARSFSKLLDSDEFKTMILTRPPVFREINWNGNDIIDVFILALRYGLAAIFLMSFLIRGFRSQISFFWLRIIESPTPFFTLLFGAIGGVATLIRVVSEQW